MATDQADRPCVGARAILVTGMHRSGTSALARVLNLAGVELGSGLMKPRFDNPTGFWESQPLVNLNDRLLSAIGMAWDSTRLVPAFESVPECTPLVLNEIAQQIRKDFSPFELWGTKDPRLCRLWPLWRGILAALGVQPCAVVCVRHPFEVAASLAQRNGFGISKSLLLWLLYTLDVEAHTRAERRVIVGYNDLLTDWPSTLTKIESGLDLGLMPISMDVAERIGAFLSSDHRHHHAGSVAMSDDSPIVALALEVFELVSQLTRGNLEVTSQLDEIYRHRLPMVVGQANRRRQENSGPVDGRHSATPELRSILGERTVETSTRRSIGGYVSMESEQRMPANRLSERKSGLRASVIIPVYNQPAHVERCLGALLGRATEASGFEVIVVDNGSAAETRAVLASMADRYSSVRVVRNEENRLLAAARNQGVGVSRAEVLVFLDSDTEVQPGWLDAGLAGLENTPRTGIVGARLLYPDGTVQHGGIAFYESEQSEFGIWPEHRFRFRDGDDPAANRRRSVAAVTGACMFMRRATFFELSGFDEAYGLYFEDVDLCMKARAGGLEVWYEPAVCVMHAEGASSSARGEIDRLRQAAAQRFFERWGEQVQELVEPEELITEPPLDLVAFGERVLARGADATARRSFERALEADPQDAVAHNDLAVMYWRNGDAARALRHLARGLEVSPDNPDLIRNTVEVLAGLGEHRLGREAQRQHLPGAGGGLNGGAMGREREI